MMQGQKIAHRLSPLALLLSLLTAAAVAHAGDDAGNSVQKVATDEQGAIPDSLADSAASLMPDSAAPDQDNTCEVTFSGDVDTPARQINVDFASLQPTRRADGRSLNYVWLNVSCDKPILNRINFQFATPNQPVARHKGAIYANKENKPQQQLYYQFLWGGGYSDKIAPVMLKTIAATEINQQAAENEITRDALQANSPAENQQAENHEAASNPAAENNPSDAVNSNAVNANAVNVNAINANAMNTVAVSASDNTSDDTDVKPYQINMRNDSAVWYIIKPAAIVNNSASLPVEIDQQRISGDDAAALPAGNYSASVIVIVNYK